MTTRDPGLASATVHCLDCGSEVSGNFCGYCGQARTVHLRSLHELLHDLSHTLTHADSRLWRTLHSLLLRPGELSRAWCAGQHARHFPPFRLYLVLSALFFALLVILPSPDHASGPAIEFSGNTPDLRCDLPQSLTLPGLPDARERLLATCEQAQRDGGRQYLARLRADAPKLLFCLVPFAAAFALLLYWRPRRLYVEHLVFGLHNQAMLFVLLGLWLAVAALATAVPALGWLGTVFSIAMPLLAAWHLYRGMRVFYGQPRWRTVGKLCAMAGVYAVLVLGLTTLGLMMAALGPVT